MAIREKVVIKIYDKRNDLDLPIVNIPLLRSNIFVSRLYRMFVYQLERHPIVNYSDLLAAGSCLVYDLTMVIWET